MKNKIVILLIIVIILTLSTDRAIIKYTEKPCVPKIVNVPTESPCTADNTDEQTESYNITYKTFSSPKADFTFEYPSTWVYYEEKIDPNNPNTTGWNFYKSMEEKSGIPIFAVVSPLTEVVDFCSGGPLTAKGWPYGFILSVFPTNDINTFITYEQCGDVSTEQNGYGYIYWQKGKYFANASEIKDIHSMNLMLYYSNLMLTSDLDHSSAINKEFAEIGKHIAQSIKIK